MLNLFHAPQPHPFSGNIFGPSLFPLKPKFSFGEQLMIIYLYHVISLKGKSLMLSIATCHLEEDNFHALLGCTIVKKVWKLTHLAPVVL